MDIKIGWQHHCSYIKFHPSDDYGHSEPLIIIWHLNHLTTQPWCSIPLLIESSHSIKSSFHVLIFPWESLCFILLLILFWFIIWFIMLSEMELSGILLDSFIEQELTSQEWLLSLHDFMMYKRLSCSEKDNQIQKMLSQLCRSSSLITASGLSFYWLNHFDYIIEWSYHIIPEICKFCA